MIVKQATRPGGNRERVKTSVDWTDPILAYGLPVVIGVGFGWPLLWAAVFGL